MVSSISEKPLTEDVVLYFLYLDAQKRNSRVFFKLKHNLSMNREWNFYFAPDIDMLEVTKEDEIIGYEAKGQRKGKTRYRWPHLYQGLDEALFYLRLPYVSTGEPEGGSLDKVFVVHACLKPEKIEKDEKLGLRIYETTPIGLLCVTPNGEIKELVEAKDNPLLDRNAKIFFLQNLDALEIFSENSRTFHQIKRKGEDFLK